MKKAIILAAGRGIRLRNYYTKPKCLLNFKNENISIIERLCKILKKRNICNITVVTGYKKKLIQKTLGKKVKYVHFSNYSKCNNLQSLLAAKNEIKGSFLCFFSDLIFDERILDKLLKKKSDFCLAVDCKKVLKGTMRIKKNKKEIISIGNHIIPDDGDGNFIGISKFSKKGANILRKYLIDEKKNRDDYYTIAIKHIANDRNTVKFKVSDLLKQKINEI